MQEFLEKHGLLENPFWQGIICLLLLLFNTFISTSLAINFLVTLIILFILFRFSYDFLMILLIIALPAFLNPTFGWIVNAAFILFFSVLIVYSIISLKAFK